MTRKLRKNKRKHTHTHTYAHTQTHKGIKNKNKNKKGTEQYAIELSLLGVTLGSILSIYLPGNHKSFKICLIIFCLITIIFTSMVINLGNFWTFKGVNISLILLVLMIRFMDGYLSPIIFRRVANKDTLNMKEPMNRWVAAIEKFFTFFGIWISYFIIEFQLIS